MRSANQVQVFGSMWAYLGISSPSFLRNDSVVSSLAAKPMMAKRLGSWSSWARLQSAGTSLRLVRSPVAPKITITQGEALGFGLMWFTVDSRTLSACESYRSQMIADLSRATRRSGTRRLMFLLDMPAELKTHGGQDL